MTVRIETIDGNVFIGTPVWFLPKIAIPIARDKVHLAAGGMFGGVLGEEQFGMGLAYGVFTSGTPDRNLTLGLCFGYAGEEWSDTPMVNISGRIRTRRALYLVSENYWFPNTDITGIATLLVMIP